jgi:two-component system, OmpR family, sensor kinase
MTETGSRRWTPSARMRILGWYATLLAVAMVAALLIQRTYLLGQVVSNTDQALDQEVGELRQLSGGIDPATGEPFGGDVRAIFDTYFERNVPLASEVVLTFVDGSPYKSGVTGSLFEGSELLERWAGITSPERDQVQTDQGPVRYLAVPLVDGTSTGGVFVAAFFLGEQLGEVDAVFRVGALVLGSIFVLATAVAWVAAGDVLRPVRLVSDTARTISESDLSRRILIEGDDEVADLASTFNSMLDRLEDAFATQRRFVDDAGHELRTPITVIRGQLELLSDDPVERDETLGLVTSELDRMSRIVEDLLILARSETPDFIEIHPIDLVDFLEEMTVKASGLSDREVTLAGADQCVFFGDRQRLTQAVTNLTRNAFEHGPPDVEVSLAGRIDGSRVRVSVTDDGPGISPEVRERLFERFYRGRPGRRSTRGSGLGLSIVRAIAEGHGGTVELDTGASGTTFTLVLPAIPPEGGPET